MYPIINNLMKYVEKIYKKVEDMTNLINWDFSIKFKINNNNLE